MFSFEQGSPFFYDSDNLQGLFQGIGGTTVSNVSDILPESTISITVEEKLPISRPLDCGNLPCNAHEIPAMQHIHIVSGEDISSICAANPQMAEDCNFTTAFPSIAGTNRAADMALKLTASSSEACEQTSAIQVLQTGQTEKVCRSRGRKQKSKTEKRTTLRRKLQPTMVDLRALLVDCAQAVAADEIKRANGLLHDIRLNASPVGNGIQRLAHYFAESLVARLSGTGGRLWTAMGANNAGVFTAKSILKAYHLFVAVCPFWKLSHFFANQAILNAAEGAKRLNIIDFNIMYGFQWPCLMKALAERKGPPFLRITGIDIPRPGFEPAERLEETGRRLEEYARMYGVPFEYHAVASRWEDVRPGALQLRQDEVLVVNCIYTLRHLMDETLAGAASPRKMVLSKIRSMNPKLFVEGVVNAGYNAPFFLSRFKEALFHYSSVFDALDTTIRRDLEERMVIEREIMGREILNVVACEGIERLERPETYRQWQWKTERAGFEMLPFDPLIKFKAEVLAKGFYHKDYGVEDDSGRWLLLGWKGRILHGISTWRPSMKDLPSW